MVRSYHPKLMSSTGVESYVAHGQVLSLATMTTAGMTRYAGARCWQAGRHADHDEMPSLIRDNVGEACRPCLWTARRPAATVALANQDTTVHPVARGASINALRFQIAQTLFSYNLLASPTIRAHFLAFLT